LASGASSTDPFAGTHRRNGHPFRLIPRTLRWRLAMSAAVLIAISFAITFVAVYRGTGSSLSQQIDRDIAADAGAFSHTLARSPRSSPRSVLQTARQYVSNQPYTGSSTLLFALVPGAPPASNQPELFSTRTIPDRGETALEQQRENRAASELLKAAKGYSTLHLPDVGHLRLLRQSVRIPGGATVIVGVGQPLAPVSSAQAGVARAFILAGILVLACALLAAYLLGTRFSAPLRRMAAVAARIDAGDLQPRIRGLENPPEEVRVLADAFNHMLDRLTEAFAGQRAFVADASHELRTPLTVIRGQLELLAGEQHPSAREVQRVATLVQAEIARISRLVDDLLLLARAERSELLRPEALDVQSYLRELWEGTLLIAQRRFELGQIPAGTLRADPHRLAQALRNLLTNAIEHTVAPDGLVRLSVTVSDAPEPAAVKQQRESRPAAEIHFVVDDDGPGIPADQREHVFARFHRTDPARDRVSGGAGLGLAIVQAIAVAHGGWVAASSNPEEGARVELVLPGFAPAGGARPDGARETWPRSTSARGPRTRPARARAASR
jgi:signal transduction histidine kinase